MSTNLLMSMWTGGRSRLLPGMMLIDTEALKLRSWRLRECALRSAQAAAGSAAQNELMLMDTRATRAVVDNYTVYTARHKTEKDMIHVWAYINGDGDEGFSCVLL